MGDVLSDQQETLPEIPIVYSSNYNIGFMKLESLHPFDSRKYEKIYKGLINSTRIKSQQLIEPTECENDTLELIHSESYLKTLCDSEVVARMVEVPPVAYLHNVLVQRYLLSPMRFATKGSLIAAEKAFLEYGWSINLSGGYHHASAENGGGFCIYADISLIIVYLMNKYGHDGTDKDKLNKDVLERIMILDLDAHQGNGHGNDKKDQIYKSCGADVYTVDFYNDGIYPHDFQAKDGIDCDVSLDFHTKDKQYLDKLKNILPNCLDTVKPQFVIYNAGTDILIGDPLGALDITPDGVIQRDYIVFNECFKRNIPIVMLLSGGYQASNAQVITNSILNLDDKFKLFQAPNKLLIDKKNNDNDDEKLNDNNQDVGDQKCEEEIKAKEVVPVKDESNNDNSITVTDDTQQTGKL